jgi:hypothetical protein
LRNAGDVDSEPGIGRGTVLVDGLVRALWTITRAGRVST